ncbi:MAG: HD domain-containing protein [Rhodospirillales bacterium]|nr:HD domain-containing protein [Rhodospirillales bacterium]
MSDLIEKARAYAIKAHRGMDQRRKYTGEPYEVHLKEVAEIVASVSDDAETIAAAWLHDVIEDTPVTFSDLEAAFGGGVAQLVREVTDVSKPGDGNRGKRKAMDRKHLAAASPRAKTVKLADIIHNCEDISRNDPKFAKVYINEARQLLKVLDGGDQRLKRQAGRLSSRSARRLG